MPTAAASAPAVAVSRREVAEAAEHLAAPSTVVRGVLDMLDAGASARPVAARLAQSPEIASQVLRLASSAAQGAGPAGSLEAAVVRVGERHLRALLLAVSTYRLLEGPLPLYGLPRLALFRHCGEVADMAQTLAAPDGRRGGANASTAYLAGLLHDLGKPILAQTARAAGRDAIVVSGPADERALLGVDHAQVGGWIARRWGLGEDLAAALEGHHASLPPEPPLARAVWLADLAVHAAGGDLDAIARLPAAAAAAGLGAEALEALLSGAPPPDAPPDHGLTARELEVLRALATGAAPKQAARELGCSPSTVHNHLHHVYRKLGVVSQAQALLLARERGWV